MRPSCTSECTGDDYLAAMTVFLGCGFVAKYRDAGGQFSVPRQWMLGCSS